MRKKSRVARILKLALDDDSDFPPTRLMLSDVLAQFTACRECRAAAQTPMDFSNENPLGFFSSFSGRAAGPCAFA